MLDTWVAGPNQLDSLGTTTQQQFYSLYELYYLPRAVPNNVVLRTHLKFNTTFLLDSADSVVSDLRFSTAASRVIAVCPRDCL